MTSPARRAEPPSPGPAVDAPEPRDDAIAGVRLLSALRLASPALPIGGFSYSQGLETAVERGWIADEAGALGWIADLLAMNIGRFEAPILHAMCAAVAADERRRCDELHRVYLASRETAELRAETLQMGYSLVRMIAGLPECDAIAHWLPGTGDSRAGAAGAAAVDTDAVALPLAWAIAARAFDLPARSATMAYVWTWAENQIMAAIKAVPLGQQAGQRMISSLAATIADTVARACELPQQQWSNFASGFVLASCWHETQYSRLFRS